MDRTAQSCVARGYQSAYVKTARVFFPLENGMIGKLDYISQELMKNRPYINGGGLYFIQILSASS